MHARKLYLSLMSAGLIGFGAFFLFRDLMQKEIALSISIILAVVSTATLYLFASKLKGLPARAAVGLSLLFGALCFGLQNAGEMFSVSVLWAMILFGALDTLGKLNHRQKRPVENITPTPDSALEGIAKTH